MRPALKPWAGLFLKKPPSMGDLSPMRKIFIERAAHNEQTKAMPTNFNEKKATCKTQNLYILLAFLLITIVLLIAVRICCCLKKYWEKQKHLLPFHITNNKLKEINVFII